MRHCWPGDNADAAEWRSWTTINCFVNSLMLSVELKRTTTDHHRLCAALPAHHHWRHRWRQLNDVMARPRVRYTRCQSARLSTSFVGSLSSCTVNRHILQLGLGLKLKLSLFDSTIKIEARQFWIRNWSHIATHLVVFFFLGETSCKKLA